MIKGGVKMAVFLAIVLVLVIIPLTSAGFFSDFFGNLTGKAVSDTTSLNITVGNSPPTITFVEVIPNQEPVESGFNTTIFNFTATDTDGGSTIDGASGEARFQLAGETTRLNTSCVNLSVSGNDVNFSCSVDMYYFDKNDANWIINVTVLDSNGASGENSSTTFQFNLLTAMVISPTSLGWPEIGVSTTNTGSNTDPVTLNNTGNSVDLSINVTGYDLQGETTSTEYIFAANLSVENVAEGCSGTVMSNATSLNITSSILQSGNNTINNGNETSGQEQIHFCVTAINGDLSSQSYSSAAIGAWLIQIIT